MGSLILTQEVPAALLDRDEVGLALARSLALCDLLLEESAAWLWIGGRIPPRPERESRQAALFARYADRLAAAVPPTPPSIGTTRI